MFIKFPKITSFHNVVKEVKEHYDELAYRPKVKIHGTNAAIRYNSGKIVAQSRNNNISVQNDNMGFANWLFGSGADNAIAERIKNEIDNTATVTLFGEWFGPGIMKGTSASNIDKRVFAIFSIFIGNDDNEIVTINDPRTIELYFKDVHPDVYVLPWAGDLNVVNLSVGESVQNFVDMANKMVNDIEIVDPWVQQHFSVSGPGEGFVFYPHFKVGGEYNSNIHHSEFKRLVFKAKGEKHKVVAQKSPVQMSPEIAESIFHYVNMVLTVSRLEQAAMKAANGVLEFDKKLIGAFLKEISLDVREETRDELSASKLEWKNVTKDLTLTAKEWYLSKCAQF